MGGNRWAFMLYMQTLGNRPDLFPQRHLSPRLHRQRADLLRHSPEGLKDETFAAMMAEAEKYGGYPVCVGRQLSQHQL